MGGEGETKHIFCVNTVFIVLEGNIGVFHYAGNFRICYRDLKRMKDIYNLRNMTM
jgi:hypothetical protein